jgi:hypothetical protein
MYLHLEPTSHAGCFRYLNGEHIACVGNQAGNGGGYCAFLQKTGGTNGAKIKELAHYIPDHGFVLLGSLICFY